MEIQGLPLPKEHKKSPCLHATYKEVRISPSNTMTGGQHLEQSSIHVDANHNNMVGTPTNPHHNNSTDIGDISIQDEQMIDTSMVHDDEEETHHHSSTTTTNTANTAHTATELPSGYLCTNSFNGIQVIQLVFSGLQQTITRRRCDSFFNASQILQLIDTIGNNKTHENLNQVLKSLEENNNNCETVTSPLELQGHWIGFDMAVALAQRFDVYEALKPLLFYDANDAKDPSVLVKQLNSDVNNGGPLVRNYSDITDRDENEDADLHSQQQDGQESPLKKAKTETGKLNTHHRQQQKTTSVQMVLQSLTNPNAPYTLPKINNTSIQDLPIKREEITKLFAEEEKSFSPYADSSLPSIHGEEIDLAIDEHGNTGLHWAGTLGRCSLVEKFICKGASIVRGNNLGESPLITSVIVTNNYDQGTFQDLLNLLYPCILLKDCQNRTVLHHIAYTSGFKRRSAAARYYLTTLLGWIVENGGKLPEGQRITIGHFVESIVNVQDKNGDTALNIAARVGSKPIVEQLLEIGADTTIINHSNLRPIDFGIKMSTRGQFSNINSNSSSSSSKKNTATATERSNPIQSSAKILTSIRSMIDRLETDFQGEISIQQQKLSKLREQMIIKSQKLAETRANLEKVRNYESNLLEQRHKLINLNKTIADQEQLFMSQSQPDLNSLNAYNNIKYDPDEPFRINTTSPQEFPTLDYLRARVKAYRANQVTLQQTVDSLNLKSSQLEAKFKRIISLCCEGTKEEDIDVLIDGLVSSVESDLDEVDMERVKGFLKKVGPGE